MSNSKTNRTQGASRRPRLEKMEDRLVMSAAPVAEISIDYLLEQEVEATVSAQAVSLAAANKMTGQTAVRNAYGFDGSGQTIAVIDSGVAWDHTALGNGFGADYKIVGGWDFAEGDWNPYDDGIMGSHGTHVAGIIGAEAGANSGVASGADIVSLRVFDDNGNGYFSWVEDALQWVHDHKDDYANPITTVNLSVGAEWNANTVPSWATLENEFAQLERDGIFISVAAGNSFTQYDSQGLSYPAASGYVVPVSAVDANGDMAYFSQRNDRVIAAPGVSITSTVPDYVGNFNNVADDWASYSGTSMAAPYVAGASMLIRQAMQTSGWSNITQDDIYQVMRDTADSIYDSVTKHSYARLNLQAAVNSVMGTDDYGSTLDSAYNLGSLTGTQEVSGTIGNPSDVDYFRFTAASSGQMTISGDFSNMRPTWLLNGATGTVSQDGNTFTFNVQQGEAYTFGIAGNQKGDYSLNLEVSSTGIEWTNLGTVTQKTLDGLNQRGGDTWYNLTASRAGTMTVEALFAQAAGNVDLELYDADMKLLASSRGYSDGERIDTQALAGQAFFLKCSGANSDVTLRITNLVQQTGKSVNARGTDAADEITLRAGASNFELSINGVDYRFANDGNLRFNINGGGGADTVNVYGGTGYESGKLSAHSLDLYGSGAYAYSSLVRNAENIQVVGGGGIDSITMLGTDGNDTFKAYSDNASMEGAGYSNTVRGFRQVNARAGGGEDRAYLYGTTGNNKLSASPSNATLYGTGFSNSAAGFDKLYVYGGGGSDQATLYGSAGNDTYIGRAKSSELSGRDYYQFAKDFSQVIVYGGAGNDTATFHGSQGDETFFANPGDSYMLGTGFNNLVRDFGTVIAHGGGGNDISNFSGSAGNDTFTATPTYGRMVGPGFQYTAYDFGVYQAFSGGRGTDIANLYGSAGDDTLYTEDYYAKLYGSGFSLYARDFAETHSYAGEGWDRAYFIGTAGDETYISRSTVSQIFGSGMNHFAHNFDSTTVYSRGGEDQAYLYASQGDNSITFTPTYVSISGGGVNNYIYDYQKVTAHASIGQNTAFAYDTTENDTLTNPAAIAAMANSDHYVSARGFDYMNTYSNAESDDSLNKASTDFIFANYGAW